MIAAALEPEPCLAPKAPTVKRICRVWSTQEMGLGFRVYGFPLPKHEPTPQGRSGSDAQSNLGGKECTLRHRLRSLDYCTRFWSL